MVSINHINLSFGGRILLNDISFLINPKDRIGLVGNNGAGKTTLLKIIMGLQMPDTGAVGKPSDLTIGYLPQQMKHIDNKTLFNEVKTAFSEILELENKILQFLKIGHNVKIGYFAQNQDELLDGEITVFDTVDGIADFEAGTKIRALLGAFLFGSDDIDKKVKVLSGGERSRLALVKLLLEPFNFLVLDELTNHLDMRSKDILKQALESFTGTMILVSHDRGFLNGLAGSVYEFRDRKIKKYIGGINDFFEKKKITSLSQLGIKRKEICGKADEQLTSTGKDSYLEKKKFFKYLRELTKKISNCESTIEQLEKELKDLEGQFDSTTVSYTGPGSQLLFSRYADRKKGLDARMHEWEQLHAELTELKKNQYYRDLVDRE